MLPLETEIYKRIDEILWEEWDPIGVNEYREARDEYSSYLHGVAELKSSNAGSEIIAHHLLSIEIDPIGLSGNLANCRRVAELIVSL